MKYILFSAVFFSTLLVAEWNKIAPTDFDVSPPPSEGSAAYKKDYAVLLKEQASRTEADCELAASQLFPSYGVFFEDAGILTKSESARVESFINKTMKFGERVTGYFKEEYSRTRPYDVDHRIEPCIKRPGGSKSYPSSHASTVTLAACVLGNVFSDRQEELRNHAEYLANLRYIVGVHHPSDVTAGKKLGIQMCKRLLNEEDFIQELDELTN